MLKRTFGISYRAKIKWWSGTTTKFTSLEIISEALSCKEDRNQEYIIMPSGHNYITPFQQLHEASRALIGITLHEEHAWVLSGEKGTGKTCFVKKLVGYIIQRNIELRGEKAIPQFKDWIYLDMESYKSVLRFVA